MTPINDNPTLLESHLIREFGDEGSSYSQESLEQLKLLADPRVFSYLESLNSDEQGLISKETFGSILSLEDGDIPGIEGVELEQLKTAVEYLRGENGPFDEIDGDGNGISLEELEAFIWQGQSISAAIQEGNSVHDFYQAVKILVDSGLLVELGNGEITPDVLKELAGEDETLNAAIDVIFLDENAEFLSQVTGEDGVLTASDFTDWKTDFENGLYIDGIIDPDGSQVRSADGGVQNCVLHATIQAISNQNPAALASLVTIDGDGNYVVTFPGDPDRPITVTQEDLENEDYSVLASGDLDLQVLTIAVEKYANEYGINEKDTTTEASISSAYYELLTGEESQRFFFGDGKGSVNNPIESFVDENGNLIGPTLVSMNMSKDGSSILHHDEDEEGAYMHALAIESVDMDAQTITLQDPYDPDHTITMSFDEFYGSAVDAITQAQDTN